MLVSQVRAVVALDLYQALIRLTCCCWGVDSLVEQASRVRQATVGGGRDVRAQDRIAARKEFVCGDCHKERRLEAVAEGEEEGGMAALLQRRLSVSQSVNVQDGRWHCDVLR